MAIDWEAARAELSKKLDKQHVKPPAPGKYGDYIEGWHAIAEANRIFGPENWSYRIERLDLTNAEQVEKKARNGDVYRQWEIGYLAIVTLTLGETVKQDVGHGQGHSKSAGEAHDSAIKEAVTDGLKRCLRTLGNPLGLALYDKTQANVCDTRAEEAAAAREAESIAKSRKDLLGAADLSALRAVYTGIMQAWGSDKVPKELQELGKSRAKELEQKEAA